MFQALWREVVGGQCQFFVFVILVVIVVRQVAEFLGSNDLLHQFDSRVVLSAVSALFGTDGYLGQLQLIGFQSDVEFILCLGCDGDDL